MLSKITAEVLNGAAILEHTGFYHRIERHSVNPWGQELVSFVVRYPRPILPEFNTHCVLTKNTSSSRAIPYKYKNPRKPGQPPCMRDMVMENPYIPIYFGREQPGMQEGAELNEKERAECTAYIAWGRNQAVEVADNLHRIGMHKGDLNRYIEPWAWTTQIITGTAWANFFALRCDQDAHAAFRYIARRMYLTYKKSKPQYLKVGDWHLPFTTVEDARELSREQLIQVSVGRTARISYNTYDGERSYVKDIDLHDKLLSSKLKHMSPFGHAGQVALSGDWLPSNFGRGWNQLRKMINGENVTHFNPSEEEILAWGITDM